MICIHCGAPGPCDCWKQRLTPAEREQAQSIIMARWVLAADRREFEERRAEEHLLDQRGGNRGGFGLKRRGLRRIA